MRAKEYLRGIKELKRHKAFLLKAIDDAHIENAGIKAVAYEQTYPDELKKAVKVQRSVEN